MPYYERRGIPTSQPEKLNIDEAYKRAQKTFDAEAVDLNNFGSLYDARTIREDREYVRARMAKFEIDPAKKLATIFEAIIHEQAELNEWLGPDITTIKSSEFDDIAHGVDTIVHFDQEEGGDADMGLAIDVTFGTHIREKLNAIMDEIERGELTEVKYLSYPDPDDPDAYIFTHSKMPRVIIGAEEQTVKDVGGLWFAKKRKELAEHPIKHLIAKEIMDQLALFEQHARLHNRSDIASSYRRMLGIMERRFKEKEKSMTVKQGYASDEALGPLKNDRILHSINDYLFDIIMSSDGKK